MRHVFKNLVFMTLLFSSINPQGTIILLNGTSSAGKSAVSKALIEMLGEASWTIIDGDYLSKTPALENTMKTIAIEFIETKLETSLSQEQKEEIMQKGYSELDLQHFGLPDEKYSKLDDYLEEQIIPQVYKSAINVAKTGKNVIVPTVFNSSMNDEFDAFGTQDNILMVLVYCPFTMLSQRIGKRNEVALLPDATAEKKSDIRPVSGVCRQFSEFYPAGNRPDMPVLEELTLDQIHEVWKFTSNEIDLFKDYATEENIKEFRRQNYNKMIDNFGFKKGQSSIRIRPQFYYDIIVNNGINSPQQCAQQIKNFIESETEFKAFKENHEKLQARSCWRKAKSWWIKTKSWFKKRVVTQNKTFNWKTRKQVFLLRA